MSSVNQGTGLHLSVECEGEEWRDQACCFHTKPEASLLQIGGADSRETESTWVPSLAVPEYSETGALNQVFEKGEGDTVHN